MAPTPSASIASEPASKTTISESTQSTPASTEPRFQYRSKTQEEEDAYIILDHRQIPKPSGVIASVAQLVKAALGAGVMSGHVGYMETGAAVALVVHIFLGVYMAYCLHILVQNIRILCKRNQLPVISYPDAAEAAMLLSGHQLLQKYAKVFRYAIDSLICTELFGACICYQLMIAKTIKQLVEDTHKTSLEPQIEGYPSLRMYLVMIIIPMILICLIRHLQWLGPLAIVGNLIIVLCIVLSVYYAFKLNPGFENLTLTGDFYGFFQFAGITVLGMSCVSVVVTIENNMTNPDQFPMTLAMGMGLIILCTVSISFFGYVAFTDQCEAPITINFPMDLGPKVLKYSIIPMIYITHGINYWVPFNLLFHYVKGYFSSSRVVLYEYGLKALGCFTLTMLGIIFPNIPALVSLLGAFCISNMAFIFPNCIELLVHWERPGLGQMRWRLWKALFLISMGLVLFIAGTYVNVMNLIEEVTK